MPSSSAGKTVVTVTNTVAIAVTSTTIIAVIVVTIVNSVSSRRSKSKSTAFTGLAGAMSKTKFIKEYTTILIAVKRYEHLHFNAIDSYCCYTP